MKKKFMARTVATVASALVVTVAAAQTPASPSENVNPGVLKVNDEVIYAAEISMTMANTITTNSVDPDSLLAIAAALSRLCRAPAFPHVVNILLFLSLPFPIA